MKECCTDFLWTLQYFVTKKRPENYGAKKRSVPQVEKTDDGAPGQTCRIIFHDMAFRQMPDVHTR